MPRFPETVKAALTDIVSAMANNPTPFVRNPLTDFTRDRMLNFEDTVNIILSMGAGSINQELLDYFQYVSPLVPSASAFVQQRAKILPDAFCSISSPVTAPTLASMEALLIPNIISSPVMPPPDAAPSMSTPFTASVPDATWTLSSSPAMARMTSGLSATW